MSNPKVEIIKKSDLVESEIMEEPQIIQIDDQTNPVQVGLFSPVDITEFDSTSESQDRGNDAVNLDTVQIKINNEVVSNRNLTGSHRISEVASSHRPSSSEEDNVFLIPPLLRIRHYGNEERIPISINEIRRRIGPPESLSQSLILSLLRLNKERAKHLRKALSQFGIKELASKSAVVSSFSRLSEAEATSLAEDYYYLASRFMKVQEMHSSLVTQNGGMEGFSTKANKTRTILEKVLAEIEKRDVDLNLLTHGFSSLILRSAFNVLIEILTFKEKDTQEITLEIKKEETS